MKKTNNKGFTLSELLIVIAIIAVLIAIAIPTFAGALDNARLQTDHANIRSAHAMAMILNMDGYVDVDGVSRKPTSTTEIFVFQKDGTLQSTSTLGGLPGNPYTLQANPKAGDCATSIPCLVTGNNHRKTATITIQYDTPAGKWMVKLY